jgi:hypothetical protein
MYPFVCSHLSFAPFLFHLFHLFHYFLWRETRKDSGGTGIGIGDSHGGEPLLWKWGLIRGIGVGDSRKLPGVYSPARGWFGGGYHRESGVGVGDSAQTRSSSTWYTTMVVHGVQDVVFPHGKGFSELTSFIGRRRSLRHRRHGYVFFVVDSLV